MEWINFRHLYSFWMVKKEGGFNAASKKMFVSQSTISEQVVQLEDYLEESLFERTTRSLKLTQAGHQLFRMADEIFDKSREINRIIRDKEGGEAPIKFRVGIVGGVSRNLLYKIFKDFLDFNDGAELEVLNGDIDELVKLCQNFELDFVITTMLPPAKALIDFKTKVIEKSPMIIAGKKKFITKIKKERGISNPIDAYVFSYPFVKGDIEERFYKKFSNSFNYKIRTDDISLLRFFSNSNDGVAIVPEIGVREDLNSGAIEKIPLTFMEDIKFYALYSKKATHFAEVESLLS